MAETEHQHVETSDGAGGLICATCLVCLAVPDVETSAIFGQDWMVEIEWSTDFDGRLIDPEVEAYARTFHGTWPTEQEAVAFMNAYPEDTDVHDMRAIQINRASPKE
jgi:hypothetical protein